MAACVGSIHGARSSCYLTYSIVLNKHQMCNYIWIQAHYWGFYGEEVNTKDDTQVRSYDKVSSVKSNL